jgi:ABC-type phosphate/phosphonate transport system permease subunit
LRCDEQGPHERSKRKDVAARLAGILSFTAMVLASKGCRITAPPGTFTTAAGFLPERSRRSAMTDVFERLEHAQIGEPIWQPVIFAILLVLISITLALILQT